MTKSKANKPSPKDLSANTERGASQAQEPQQVSFNQQNIQHNQFISASEIAQIAAVDKELARDIVKEFQSEHKRLNDHFITLNNDEQKIYKINTIFSNIISILLIVLFFVVVIVLALNDKLTLISSSLTGLPILAGIITALGIAVSKIIKAIKEPPRPSNK